MPLTTHDQLLKKCGDVDPLTWAKAYVEELNRKEEDSQFEYIARYSGRKQLEKGKQLKFKGGYLFLQSLYHQLGLGKICQEIEENYKFTYNLSDILCMLVATRILDPSSKCSSLTSAG